MELFIKKIATIVSHGNSDKAAILAALHNWKAIVEEDSLLQKALKRISKLLYGKEEKPIGQLLADMEERIGENQEMLEFTKAIELIFHQPVSGQLLDEINDCWAFRNILSPYIVKYNELLSTNDSAMCLEKIVKILEERQ
jgi:hypothetical protein